MMRLEALTAVTGVVGTIFAQAMPDAGQMEAMAKWPITLVMAAVAVISIFLMYKGNRDNSKDRLEEARMHKESIETLAKSFYDSHNKLSDSVLSGSASLTTAVNANTAELRERPCIRKPENN